jgi:hypothetical protein
VIRRIVSILLFAFGGWMLTTELAIAFLDMEPGIGDNALLIVFVAFFTVIPLMLAAWASPGKRWRELGLTTLIAVGVGLLCGVTMAAVLMDPGFKPFMPPMPKIAIAPIAGAVNLLIVAAVGALLYRTGRGELEADSGSSPG